MFNNCIKSKLLLGAAVSALMLGSAVNTAIAEDYTTGAIKGVVRNELGTNLQGASILIKSNKGVTRTATSDANGKFRIPALPIGKYSMTITKDGYNILADQSISVLVGSAGIFTFTMNSEDATMEEVFVVGTRQAGYDFNTTTTGLTVNVDELVSRTPISRDATAVALLAPGTVGGDTAFAGGNSQGLASIGGASVAENAFYINGMNVTNFRNGLGASTIPFEFYENIEVKTGGYQAEFGRSTGGLVNTVTRSGSNEFHAAANVFWEGNTFRGHSPDSFNAVRRFTDVENLESNYSLSGPIVKDKLFFYALYNQRSFVSSGFFTNGQKVTTTKDAPFWGLKFDAYPFEGHHLEVTLFSDDQTQKQQIFNFTDDGSDKPMVGSKIGTNNNSEGGFNQIYKYTGVLADWLTVSGLYGINEFNRTAGSTNDAFPVIVGSTGFRGATSTQLLGSWTNFNIDVGKDRRETFRFDADVYFSALGDHHVRMGYDREQLTAENNTINSGGVYYRYFEAGATDRHGFAAGEEYVRVQDFANGGNFRVNQTAQYIQDSWQVSDTLTLNLGLRNETFENLNGNGKAFIKIKNQIAWRAGVTWDPTGDGTNRIYGNWGRYYLPVAANTNIRMAGAETFTRKYYLLDSLNADETPNFDVANLRDTEIFGDGTVPSTAEVLDTNIKPMYQDEYIIGYDHDFGNGWTVGARGIYRNLGRLIEDISIDEGVGIWAAANGFDAAQVASVWSGVNQYVLTNPGQDVTVSLDKEGLTGLAGDAGQFVQATITADQLGFPKGKRTYKAIEISFAREWDGVWSIQGSYTLSWSKGNYEGSVKSDNGQDDAGLTQDFDLRGLMDGAFGFLPNDRRHKIKVWGAYQVTDWLNVGAKYTGTSGRKFGCIGFHPDPNNPAVLYGASSWYCNGVLTPRGSQLESDFTHVFDMSFNITPGFNSQIPGDMMFRVDVFNVFNSHAVRDIHETGEISGVGDLDPNYGKPSSFQRPRTVRLSANYKF